MLKTWDIFLEHNPARSFSTTLSDLSGVFHSLHDTVCSLMYFTVLLVMCVDHVVNHVWWKTAVRSKVIHPQFSNILKTLTEAKVILPCEVLVLFAVVTTAR